MSMPPLHSALVQILFRRRNGEHRPAGGGFLVAPRHILTCAHVVNDSLGLQPQHAEQPSAPIWLDFPMLLPRSPHAPLKAKVNVWHPMRCSLQPDELDDIAVLKVMDDFVLPHGARAAPLVKVDNFFDRPVRLIGFPGKKDEADWLDGKLQSNVENGRVQIDTGLNSRPVRSGFSGAPVWETREDAVVGMIVAANTGMGVLSAYMIPAANLIKADPDLPTALREPLAPAPGPFLHLRERFSDSPAYFPSWEDLQHGRFYFHSDYHEQIDRHLAKQCRALIVGHSGSGKTALAYSLGFRFLQGDFTRRAFYIDTAPRSPSAWLDAMRAFDRPEYLFIIDNAHDFPDACNEFLDTIGAVRHARLLLVSQPLPASLVGPEDKSYLGRLRQYKVELKIDSAQLEEVLHVYVQLAECAQKSAPIIGDMQKLLRKCEGNLHVLKYYVMAWDKQPQRALSDIDEREVLDNLEARYLAGKPYANALARLGSLWQFEISADRVFFANPDALERDPLVEQRENRWGDPQLCVYHATTARYLALAHVRRTMGHGHFNAWTSNVLSDYLRSRPSNFLEVFYQLRRSERLDLVDRLLATLPLEELFQAHLDKAEGVEELDIVGTAHFIGGVWEWEKATAPTLARQLVERLDCWLARQGYVGLWRLNLWEGIWLSLVQIAAGTASRWLRARSPNISLNAVLNFLLLCEQSGIDKTALRLFIEELDFKGLGNDRGI